MNGDATANRGGDLFRPPENALVYVAVVAALVSAGIHLLLAPRVMAFLPTRAVLFYLNAAGWLVGVVVLFTRYWRREFYLVAAGYGVLTLLSFFAMGGQLNALALASKGAETVVAAVCVYLYAAGS